MHDRGVKHASSTTGSYLILPLYHGLLQQNALIPIYAAGTLEEARDLTVKCLTFRLELESTVGGSTSKA